MLQERVSSTNPRYGRVAEASRCDVGRISAERGVTFSQMKNFCILQGSAVTFFRCGGKWVTVCFLLR